MEGDARAGLTFNPARSRFLLIGTSKYDHLSGLPAVDNNLDALDRILRDTSIVGVPSENILLVRNPDNKAQISNAFIEAANQADDLLFIYFSGHGLLGRSDKLFLSTVKSTDDNCEHDAFAFDEIRTRLKRTPPKQRIIILDCCFSGNAIDGAMGSLAKIVEENIQPINDVDAKSSFEIASVPPNRIAMAPIGMRYTAFTGELIRLLEYGTDSSERFFDIESIYEELRQRIQRMGLPEPRSRSLFRGGKLIFARNKFGSSGVALGDLQRAIEGNLSVVQVQIQTTFASINHTLEDLAKQIPPLRRRQLKDFSGITAPSFNYETNRSTFSARLSEAVFGSLIVAYILGFVGFVAVYLQSVGRIGSATELAQGVDTLARLALYPDGIVIGQFLCITIVFALYTAVMYFNYHQSIMYLSSDQRKTSIDFIISVGIGLLYGWSMVFPLSTIFCIGTLTLAVLLRKSRLLRPFHRYLAFESKLTEIHFDPAEGTSQKERERSAIKSISKALLALKGNGNLVLQSWGRSGGIIAWTVAALMSGGSLIAWWIAKQTELKFANDQTIFSNIIAIGGTAIMLFVALWRATRVMPSKQEEESQRLDDQLNAILVDLLKKRTTGG